MMSAGDRRVARAGGMAAAEESESHLALVLRALRELPSFLSHEMVRQLDQGATKADVVALVWDGRDVDGARAMVTTLLSSDPSSAAMVRVASNGTWVVAAVVRRERKPSALKQIEDAHPRGFVSMLVLCDGEMRWHPYIVPDRAPATPSTEEPN